MLLGLDHGGTTSKAVLFTQNGQAVASAKRVTTPMHTPQSGFTERDMEELWRANCEVIRETDRNIRRTGVNPTDIIGVSVSGHGKGLYLWGKDQKPAYPGIVSTDSRAWKIIQTWNQGRNGGRRIPADISKRIGVTTGGAAQMVHGESTGGA